MLSANEIPTEEEIDNFYEYFIEHGFFHGDQYRIQEKDLIKLSDFFYNAFCTRGYAGNALAPSTLYDHDWGTIVWFSDQEADHNEISKTVKKYIQAKLKE